LLQFCVHSDGRQHIQAENINHQVTNLQTKHYGLCRDDVTMLGLRY
jgi:hypothetical protein